MPPIVTDRVTWSVGLSVGLSLSEPCKKFGSDRDAVCVEDSGGPMNYLLDIAERFQPNTIMDIPHNTAI